MPAVRINAMKLAGPWTDGWVLDYHSISSVPTSDPYYPYDTKRTELGDMLFRLKYRGGSKYIPDIVDTIEEFFRRWDPPVECIVPALPSTKRNVQPVVAVANEFGNRLGLPVLDDVVVKTKKTSQMKNIIDFNERERLLRDALQEGSGEIQDKSVLLFDDLTESGSTLRSMAGVLRAKGAKSIYALALTRTR
jgi:competence protein ComFC